MWCCVCVLCTSVQVCLCVRGWGDDVIHYCVYHMTVDPYRGSPSVCQLV